MMLEEDTGISQGHTISTKQSLFYTALSCNKPNYIQYLPANVEGQINLWNTNGVTMETHVKDDGYCTQHCHCDYPKSECINGIYNAVIVV
jgi:hypothetical protein